MIGRERVTLRVADYPAQWRSHFPKDLSFIPYLDGSGRAAFLRKRYTHFTAVPVPGRSLMNNLLHKWLEGLGTAYPSASNSYWRTMPLGRMKKLLAAAFFTVSVFGFVLDLLLLNHPHLGRGLVWPLLMGAMAAGTLAARIKKTHLYPPSI